MAADGRRSPIREAASNSLEAGSENRRLTQEIRLPDLITSDILLANCTNLSLITANIGPVRVKLSRLKLSVLIAAFSLLA